MDASRTTAAVQRYLDELRAGPGDTDAPEVVRELLERSAIRLQLLCSSMLRRSYSRLTRPPLNLSADEMLGSVVERLIKALRKTQPATVRDFFALANQHIRWELNDLARRLDEHTSPVEIDEQSLAAAGPDSSLTSTGTTFTAKARRILAALDSLDADEREVLGLLRIQEMTHAEAARILGVSTKTVQRRLNRGRVQLAALLRDLEPHGGSAGAVVADA